MRSAGAAPERYVRIRSAKRATRSHCRRSRSVRSRVSDGWQPGYDRLTFRPFGSPNDAAPVAGSRS